MSSKGKKTELTAPAGNSTGFFPIKYVRLGHPSAHERKTANTSYNKIAKTFALILVP